MGKLLYLTKDTNEIGAQFVIDQIEALANRYVQDSVQPSGDIAGAIIPMLQAIAAKCVYCQAGENGRVLIADLAECTDKQCPLSDYAAPIFRLVLTRAQDAPDPGH
jgi:hypothetical protein